MLVKVEVCFELNGPGDRVMLAGALRTLADTIEAAAHNTPPPKEAAPAPAATSAAPEKPRRGRPRKSREPNPFARFETS